VETGGPASGAVPKAGGAPAGGSAAFCSVRWHAAAAAISPAGAALKNCLRDFDMVISEDHCSRSASPFSVAGFAGVAKAAVEWPLVCSMYVFYATPDGL